jgi:transposase
MSLSTGLYSPDYNPLEEALSKIKKVLWAKPRPGAKRL